MIYGKRSVPEKPTLFGRSGNHSPTVKWEAVILCQRVNVQLYQAFSVEKVAQSVTTSCSVTDEETKV